MKIYAIFDKKGKSYSCVNTAINDDSVVRVLHNEVNSNNPVSLLCTNSADFDLYCLGDLDLRTGVISPDVTFVLNLGTLKIMTGGEFDCGK